LRESFKGKLQKLGQGAQQSKSKMEVAHISIKKFIVIDRNPPSPYSVDRADKEIFIDLEDKDKIELFLKYYEEITKADDDEQLLGFVNTRVQRTMKKYVADSKDKIIYYAQCKLVQLFEHFFGFVVVKATKVFEFIPVINVTKDVELKIPLREVKYVNDHRYMFKPVGALG